MKINPITKKYTNTYKAPAVMFTSTGDVAGKSADVFCSQKTIVNNTPIEFSNSRGRYLADIDLTDIYISDGPKHNMFKNKRTIVNNTPVKFGSAVKFLADAPLADTFELSNTSKNSGKVSNISFRGPYPQYLIDQDAVEQYETASNGIDDIANSTYCSFNGSQKPFFSKICGLLKEYLPL